jgi:hypothetical protein
LSSRAGRRASGGHEGSARSDSFCPVASPRRFALDPRDGGGLHLASFCCHPLKVVRPKVLRNKFRSDLIFV